MQAHMGNQDTLKLRLMYKAERWLPVLFLSTCVISHPKSTQRITDTDNSGVSVSIVGFQLSMQKVSRKKIIKQS